jgi:hypothetical protein
MSPYITPESEHVATATYKEGYYFVNCPLCKIKKRISPETWDTLKFNIITNLCQALCSNCMKDFSISGTYRGYVCQTRKVD